jgi:hypothetical protein
MSNENTEISTDDETLTTESTMTEQDINENEVALEQDLAADAETTGDKPKKEKKEKAPAAHLAFIEAVRVHASALGLGYKDQAGFAQFFESETGHKLYIAKQGKQVKRVDTTLPLVGVMDGAFELDSSNGKIACHIPAEQGAVFQALEMMAEKSFGKVRPANRPPAKAKAESTETVVEATAE